MFITPGSLPTFNANDSPQNSKTKLKGPELCVSEAKLCICKEGEEAFVEDRAPEYINAAHYAYNFYSKHYLKCDYY